MAHQNYVDKKVRGIFKKYSYNLPKGMAVNNMTSYLDQAYEDEIVFYRLGRGREYTEMFEKRLCQTKSKIIVLGGERYFKENRDITYVGQDFDLLMQECVDSIYPLPRAKKFIGVTGTNGKSSVVSFISQMATQAEIPVLSIGTQGVFIDTRKCSLGTNLTTPSHIDLRRIVFYNKEKFNLCVLEVSSHALHQNRIRGLTFDLCVWTNFTQDHLDYHKTMESYYEAKLQIRSYLSDTGRILIPKTSTELVRKNIKEFCPVDIEKKEDVPFFCHLLFNRINLSLALQALKRLYDKTDFDPFSVTPVPGRANIFSNDEKTVVVDFAHTPDALSNITQEMKKNFSKKILLLFGAGGNRDQSKRIAMGKIAEEYADFIYLTSDNSRHEKTENIIDEIKAGISSNKYEIIVNRREAIMTAIQRLQTDEILIVAGRGCEENIDIQGTLYPLNDIDVVQETLGKRNV